jgi:hypothetical protein
LKEKLEGSKIGLAWVQKAIEMGIKSKEMKMTLDFIQKHDQRKKITTKLNEIGCAHASRCLLIKSANYKRY